MGFVRLVVFGFIFLSIIYFCLSWFSRSVRREKLEEDWAEERPDGVSRDQYVTAGIEKYNSSLRPKLLLLVYVVPTILVAGIIYATNAN